MPSKWLSLVSGVPLALLLVSCGGGGSTSPYGGGGGGTGGNPASCAGSGASATITATGSFTFSPSTATIAAGQKVCWVNNSGISHNVTSDDGGFTGGSLANATTVVVTFPTAGSYPFHCSLHPPPTYNMTGTITVQ
jgi:plastocyanin